ncbi:MAG TPA: T9SS type A sorting domain-containing protein, partial [Rhodothermales bacterium]
REPEIVHGTIHFGDPAPNNRNSGEAFRLNEGAFADDFHVFAVEKEAGVIRWFVDDVLYSTKTPDDTAPHVWPFDERFHFILNVAVGGNFPGNPDASTVFPQVMEVDYVRVYDAPLPYVTGDRVVAFREQGVRYSVGNAPAGGTITWTVPPGATIASGQGTPEIVVDWGEAGGSVAADVSSPCGNSQLTIDVLVESAFAKDFTFLNFDDPASALRVFSSGSWAEINNPDPTGFNSSPRSARYTRNSSQQYDVLVLSTDAIPDATEYREGRRKFFLDVYTTAPVGTTVLLQLESTARVSSPYPVGRHSRYEAHTTVQNQWERLELPLLDRPDPNTPDDEIDQIVILFAPNTFTNHVYTIDNLDSYAPSSTETGTVHQAPGAFRLHPNFPNPFGASTEIRYELDRPMHARLRVYNLLGETLATPVDAVQAAGTYRLRFDGQHLPSGVYFYRLEVGESTETRRMVLTR